MRRCLLVFFFAVAVLAEETPLSYDVVVVVDNSISMADRKGMVVSAVRELASCSFAHQIETGDRLRFWTCDSETEETEPKEWDAEDITYTSASMAEAVRRAKFQRGMHLGPKLAELAALAPQTDVLMAVIFTDGEEPFTAVGAAGEINRELPRLRREAARLKRPIQIALTARHGKWADWRISVGADPRFLCRLPARPKPVQVPTPAPEVTPPPAVVELKAPEPEPAKAFLLPPGAKIVASVVEPASTSIEPVEIPAVQADASIEAPPPVPQQKVRTASPEVKQEVRSTSPEPVEETVPVPVAVSLSVPPPESLVTGPALVQLVIVSTNSPPPAAQAADHSPASIPAEKSIVADSSGVMSDGVPLPAFFAAAGGGCLLLGAGILLKRGRAETPKETFISQSLAK